MIIYDQRNNIIDDVNVRDSFRGVHVPCFNMF